LPKRNGNPVAMFTAGEETSSPTGRVLSPSSVPKGKKMYGTFGSVRLLTETVYTDTDNIIANGIDFMPN